MADLRRSGARTFVRRGERGEALEIPEQAPGPPKPESTVRSASPFPPTPSLRRLRRSWLWAPTMAASLTRSQRQRRFRSQRCFGRSRPAFRGLWCRR